MISLAVSAADADVIGDEPVFFKGAVAGWVTSGGYAHASDMSVALAMVDKDHANQIDGWTIELLGQMLPTKRLERPLFDPAGTRMRA